MSGVDHVASLQCLPGHVEIHGFLTFLSGICPAHSLCTYREYSLQSVPALKASVIGVYKCDFGNGPLCEFSKSFGNIVYRLRVIEGALLEDASFLRGSEMRPHGYAYGRVADSADVLVSLPELVSAGGGLHCFVEVLKKGGVAFPQPRACFDEGAWTDDVSVRLSAMPCPLLDC